MSAYATSWPAKRRAASSVYPLHLGQVVRLDGRVLPQSLNLGVPDADLGQFEQESHHGVVGEDLLRLAVELLALGLVGREIQFLDHLVEGRIVVVEVIV